MYIYIAHLVIKISDVLVTLVAATENCFQEPFKTIETVQISKFISQQVPNCWASIVEHPTAIHAELSARWFRMADHRQQRHRAASEAGMRWTAR